MEIPSDFTKGRVLSFVNRRFCRSLYVDFSVMYLTSLTMMSSALMLDFLNRGNCEGRKADYVVPLESQMGKRPLGFNKIIVERE